VVRMFESIREQEPELERLQAVVIKLEQEEAEAQTRVAHLQTELQETRNSDLDREALALNRGQKPPKPKASEVEAQLEDAARAWEVLQRRLQLAQSDVAGYISENAQALSRLVSEAKAAKAREVSELAAPLAKALHEYQLPDADARALKPYVEGPAQENTLEPQDSVYFLGPMRRENAFGTDRVAGESIGRVQALVSELVGLAARFSQGGDTTIVGPTPEESGEGAA
jgi:chromosome segregation ATPase